MKKTWVIGTRGSKLALRQTDMVIGELQAIYPECRFEIKTIKTTGDTIWDKPLQSIGEKGLFVKEIQEELLKSGIDMAVHSMKDLPTDISPGLAIGAILKREDPRDAFLSLTHADYGEIKPGSRIGTNSLRRRSQILNLEDGVVVIPIRGNIDTRIKKIESLDLDGIVLAYAGVKRMGFEHLVKDIFPLDTMVPPSGQGAIGVEVRDEEEAIEFLRPLDDVESRIEVTLERRLQTMIGGGCSVPLGINVSIEGNELTLRAAYGDEDGLSLKRIKETGLLNDAEGVLIRAYRTLVS